MRTPIAFALLAIASSLALPAEAEEPAPTAVGRWKTIDDESKKPKSIVAITEEDGALVGTIVELLDPPADNPDPRCTKCQGERKDQPIRGMKILWGLKKDGMGWSGGRILDPNNGKTYKCNLTLAGGGEKLDVRGYIGLALIGRTQTWLRVE